MTQLTITPRVSDKTARFKGTIAAGEHVAVTIKGGAAWMGEDSGENLTLRVLDIVTRRTLAVFPRPPEMMPDGATPDAWSASEEDENDLYCELDLNTNRMVAAARHMLRVPVVFVLGDTDDPRTLYFCDRYEVEYWPERIGDTAPYNLDEWPRQIDEWTALVAEWQTVLTAHVSDTSNPHSVTAAQVGLGNVENTSDNNKPVSTAQQAALNGKADKVAGAAGGNFASLDSNGNLVDSTKKPADFAPSSNIQKEALSSGVQASLGKADTALQAHQSLDAYVNGAEYDSSYSTTGYSGPAILFKHDSSVVAYVPAAAFVKDGMVSEAKVEGGNLVVKFNTDAGKQDISIPITSIFNSANYYDKTATDALLAAKAAASHTHAQSDVTGLGAALDAKLSRAEADAGYTRWTVKCDGMDVTAQVQQPYFDSSENVWITTLIEGDLALVPYVAGSADSTALEWTGQVYDPITGPGATTTYTATRTLLRPTKTSQLTNDGNGTSNFATVSQIPSVPVISTDIAQDATSDVKTASPKAVKTCVESYATLTPDYSTWTVLRNGEDITSRVQQPEPYVDAGHYFWVVLSSSLSSDFTNIDRIEFPSLESMHGVTTLSWAASDSQMESVSYVATRSVVGYVLGSQSTKMLQPKGDYQPTLSAAQLEAIADVANKADAAALRYDLGTAQVIDSEAVETDSTDPENPIDYGEATMADRTANLVVITAAIDELRLAFPDAVSGKIRDFELRVVVDASDSATDIAAPALVLPQGVTPENPDATMPTIEGAAAGETSATLLYLSENAPGVFVCKGEAMKEVE